MILTSSLWDLMGFPEKLEKIKYKSKRCVAYLLNSRKAEFVDDMSKAFLQSFKEIQRFEPSVKSLCETWLAICPHTFFTELFLERTAESVNENETPVVRN